MITHSNIETNGIRLHVAMAGPEDGPPVLLLHGFPDFWFCWEQQMKVLADAGFRVIAPDQRGYNTSDKPLDIQAYAPKELVADMIGLMDALEIKQFNLAGHDFGGFVSWALVTLHPDRVKNLCIISAPHFKASLEYNKTQISQRLKSWYVGFFQLLEIPERLIQLFNYALLRRNMPADLSEVAIERYIKAWSQPNGLRSMINWYRAITKSIKDRAIEYGRVEVPTQILWGQKDAYLEVGLGKLSLEQCTNGKLTVFEEGSHWVMHDKSEAVSEILLQHFS